MRQKKKLRVLWIVRSSDWLWIGEHGVLDVRGFESFSLLNIILHFTRAIGLAF